MGVSENAQDIKIKRMKKIGIATFYESDNYGTVLQAFALLTIVKKLGYDAEIINYKQVNLSEKDTFLKKIIQIITNLGFKRLISIILSKKHSKVRKRKFANFRKEKLTISQTSYSTDVNKLDKSYDIFITGSDMVWSWESRYFLDFYFLKFASLGKRISYAPSFGNTNFTREMIDYYIEAIKNIDYCSCREEKGSDFVRSLGRKCEYVLDPTLLLSKDTWKNVFNLSETTRIASNAYVLIYLFGELTPKCKKNINKFVGERTIRYIPFHYKQYKHEAKYGIEAYGPIDFVEAFYNADFIITDAFHGLMFSLIFEKPFVLLHRAIKEHWVLHEERMASVLHMFHLENRYLDRNSSIDEQFYTLDYEPVKKIIEDKKRVSMQYLECALRDASENYYTADRSNV